MLKTNIRKEEYKLKRKWVEFKKGSCKSRQLFVWILDDKVLVYLNMILTFIVHFIVYCGFFPSGYVAFSFSPDS